jgi:adenine phosphoribosyltransferase
MDKDSLRHLIRTVHDWPKPGVNFFDICSVTENPEAFGWTVQQLQEVAEQQEVEAIVSPDARGFLFGAPVAFNRRLPLHLARKPGKLPGQLVTQSYDYEYSSAEISMQSACALHGKKVLIIDDVLATGGTVLAIVDLLNGHFGVPSSHLEVAVVLNLKFLPGEARLAARGVSVTSLIDYHE